jgi:hypothetical protein
VCRCGIYERCNERLSWICAIHRLVYARLVYSFIQRLRVQGAELELAQVPSTRLELPFLGCFDEQIDQC